jgi:hypothetical protein
MSQTVFFMTRADVIDVIRTVESGVSVDYVRKDAFKKGDPVRRFPSGLDLPDLGIATKGATITCDTYLVVLRDAPVQPHFARDVALIDQSVNPESITFTPAGVHASGVMLFGRVATVHDDPVARKLMSAFRRAIQRHCKKVKAFYLGAEAERLWRNGARLTVGVSAAPEFDLTPEQASATATNNGHQGTRGK